MNTKKGLLAVLIVLPALMAAKCTFGGEPFESPNNYTPYKLISKNDYPGEVTYKGNELTDKEGIIREYILKIEKYQNTKELKTTSNESFTYDLRTNGIGFFISMGANITFYADGYVDVDPPSSYSSLEDHYYYSFDQESATKLFGFISEYFTTGEQTRIENEEYINNFDMDYMFSLLDQKESVEITYAYPEKPINNTTSYTFDDNGELYSLIKNAHYSYSSGVFDERDLEHFNSVMIKEIPTNKDGWSFTINNLGFTRLYVRRADKYNREYIKIIESILDPNDRDAIFAKALEITNAHFGD